MANEEVKVRITADGAQVGPAVAKVKKQLDSVGDSAGIVGQAWTKAGALIAGALSVGALTGFLRHVNELTDSLNDLADRTGASASGLQAIQLAARLAGGSADGANTALAKMSVTIGDGLAGTKAAVQAFDHLGLSAKQLAALKPDEAFRLISDKLAALPNSFERASAAQGIFSKGAKDLAGLFAAGGAAIDEVNAKLEEQGARLDDIDVKKIGIMNDELAFQGTVVTNLAAKFLSGLSPAIVVASNTLAEMITRTGGATEAGKSFGVVMVFALKTIEAAAYSVASIFQVIRSGISTLLAVALDGAVKLVEFQSRIAAFLGDDERAKKLHEAAELARGFADSLHEIGQNALQSSKDLASFAIEAGIAAAKAPLIFDQVNAEITKRAAAAAAQNAALQGAGSGFEVPDSSKEKKDKGVTDSQALAHFGRISEVLNDPTTDPRFLQEQGLQAALEQLRQQNADLNLATIQKTNRDILDDFFNTNAAIIQAEQYKNQTLGASISDLAGIAAQQGGVLGKIGKAYAIAQTVWSTSTAIMRVMAEVPFPANLAAAAGIAARGAVQLGNIKKTNIGSSGSIAHPSNGGSSALSDSVPATQPRSTESDGRSVSQVVIQGNVFSSQETANWIIDQIRDAVNTRDVTVINSSSRQALDLVGG